LQKRFGAISLGLTVVGTFQMGFALGQVTSPKQIAGFLVAAIWLWKGSDPEKLFNAFS